MRRCEREGVAWPRGFHGERGARCHYAPTVVGGRFMPRDTWYTEFYFDVLGYLRSWQPVGGVWRFTVSTAGIAHDEVRAHLAEPSPLPEPRGRT